MFYYGKNSLNQKDKKKINEVLNEGYLSQGKSLTILEKKFAKYVGAKYCLAVSSGTAALHLAISCLKLDKKNKAVTTPMTFVATVNACIYSNIDFDLVDIDSKNFNICPKKLIKYFNNKNNQNLTKIIIPVHFGGFSCDMKEISSIAKKNNAYIIEDASQAMGAEYKKDKIGSCKYSDISVFSMHPVKTITSGEGGLITTNNKTLFEKMKLMRSHGLKRKKGTPWTAEMITIGYNYRITDLQTSLAISQLERINGFIKKREKIARFYKQNLKGNNISFQERIDDSISSNHLFILIFNNKISHANKVKLYNDLLKRKIKFAVQYLPINKHKYYKKKFKKNYKNSENLYKNAINLPIYTDLTHKNLLYIVKNLNKIIKKYNL